MSGIWGEADENDVIFHACIDNFWGEMGSQIITNQDHLFFLMFPNAQNKLLEKPCFKGARVKPPICLTILTVLL